MHTRTVTFGALYFSTALGLAFAQTVDVASSTIPGVDIVGPESPVYQATINELFGADIPNAVRDWLPYGIAITNHTSKPIFAFAVRWSFMNGRVQTGMTSLLHEGFDQPAKQIAPSKTAIVFGHAVVLDRSLLPSKFQPQAPGNVQPGDLQLFKRSKGIGVLLDGVVFSDGQFVGPDTGSPFEVFLADVTIPRQIAATILEMKNSGASASRIASWLESTGTQPVDIKAGGWGMASTASHTARQLLRTYNREGAAKLYEIAEIYTRTLSIQLHK